MKRIEIMKSWELRCLEKNISEYATFRISYEHGKYMISNKLASVIASGSEKIRDGQERPACKEAREGSNQKLYEENSKPAIIPKGIPNLFLLNEHLSDGLWKERKFLCEFV